MLKQRAAGVFLTYDDAETALIALKNRGFSMNQVSVVGRDIHHHPLMAGSHASNQLESVGNLETDDNESNEGAKAGAVTGSTLGGLTGLLVGLGAVTIPGIGPIMLSGAVATAIATTISGTIIGAAAGSLAGALIGLGLPSDRADIYSDRVSHGHYLVMAEGTESELSLADEVLHEHKIQEWYIYHLPHELAQSIS